MIKNNWFNRFFHASQVAECQKEASRVTALYARRNEFLKDLEEFKTLEGLLEFHKRIWKEGYRNANIGPCSYGMFRTENIETMKPEEVFLGSIYGLVTRNIPFWEAHKEDYYGSNGFGIDPETMLYDIIVRQYKRHLISNVKGIVSNAKKMIDEYDIAGYRIYFQGSC